MAIKNSVQTKLRIVALGKGAAGKTSLLRQFFQNTFLDRYRETVEDLFQKKFLLNGNLVELEALDTAGNLCFPPMRRLSMTTAQGFLLVYSLVDEVSFEQVKELLDEIADVRCNDCSSIPIVIAGNKLDLVCDEGDEFLRAVPKSVVEDFVYSKESKFNISHIEASARTGENVLETFEQLAKMHGLVTPLHLNKFVAESSSSAADGGGGLRHASRRMSEQISRRFSRIGLPVVQKSMTIDEEELPKNYNNNNSNGISSNNRQLSLTGKRNSLVQTELKTSARRNSRTLSQVHDTVFVNGESGGKQWPRKGRSKSLADNEVTECIVS